MLPTVTDWTSYTAHLNQWLFNHGVVRRLVALLNSGRPMWALVRDDEAHECKVVYGVVRSHDLDCTSRTLSVLWGDSTAPLMYQRFFKISLDDLADAPFFATEAEAHLARARGLSRYMMLTPHRHERIALHAQICDSMTIAFAARPEAALTPPAPSPPSDPKPPPFKVGDEVWYVRIRPARNTSEYDMSHRPRKLTLQYIDDKPRRSDVWGRFVRLQSPGGTMTVSDIVGTEVVRKPKLDHAIFRTEAEALTAVMRYVDPELKTMAAVCKRRKTKLQEAEARHTVLQGIHRDVTERVSKV